LEEKEKAESDEDSQNETYIITIIGGKIPCKMEEVYIASGANTEALKR
jgi:hypothetical protein